MSRYSRKGTIFSIKTNDIDKEQTSTVVTVTKAYGGMSDAVLKENLLQFNEKVKRYKEKNNVFKVKTKMSIKRIGCAQCTKSTGFPDSFYRF